MVHFYLFLCFFSFFKQRGILGYAIRTSNLFKGTVKKEIKQNKIKKVTMPVSMVIIWRNRSNHLKFRLPQRILYAFSINSRFVNSLAANILSRFANMLGQFLSFIHLIHGFNNVVYTCVWDFCVMAKRIRQNIWVVLISCHKQNDWRRWQAKWT